LGDDFNFEITVDDEIDTSYDTIPAMLLQPIVENAIKHGLKHKLGNKFLKVSFKLMDDSLQIEIDDNGIGRVASAKINASRKNHQSFATKSIEDRIHILNEQNESKINIEIIDKMDVENNAIGTKVIITFSK
jgi:LytS/YehU family sensor histidine kinase